MSLIATQAHCILKDIFPARPFKRVFEEHYIQYRGQKLFFDFYVPELMLLVECQGEQHFKFVKHFHADKKGFLGQKSRDNLKIEYIQQENLYLVYLNYNEKLTKKLVYDKISKAMESEYNICF